MTSKKFNREQIQRCLDVLDALARSGLSTEVFAQAQGPPRVRLVAAPP